MRKCFSLSVHGGFNIHPGLLPEFAGRDPVSWSIFDCSSKHGVTLHKMTPIIDGGDIISYVSFAIDPDETAYSLFGKCSFLV